MTQRPPTFTTNDPEALAALQEIDQVARLAVSFYALVRDHTTGPMQALAVLETARAVVFAKARAELSAEDFALFKDEEAKHRSLLNTEHMVEWMSTMLEHYEQGLLTDLKPPGGQG